MLTIFFSWAGCSFCSDLRRKILLRYTSIKQWFGFWRGSERVQLKDAYYFPKEHASAENFQGYRWAGWRVFLKIEIDRKDLDSLIKHSPFAGRELLSDRRFVLKEPTLSWWDPDSVRNYRSAQAPLPDARYLNILLDLDRDEGITIYLQWGET